MIYFDNAATTYPKPESVYKAIDYGMRNFAFNSGRGMYDASYKTFNMIKETREKLGSVVGLDGDNVVFTGSATESLNAIIRGLNICKGDSVLVSPFDHNAIVRTVYGTGAEIIQIPFDKETWRIDEQKLNNILVMKKPKAIVISHISNVTGFELPYVDIFRIGKKYKTINVLDSAQGFGIYNINKENVDFVVFAGHKSLYAMAGIAGYINTGNVELDIYKFGGTGSDSLNLNMPESVPMRYEAGSSNAVGIYSINAAIDYLKSDNYSKKEEDLTEYLITRLKELNNVKIYLPDGYIPKGIVSINIEGYKAEEVGEILSNEYNICLRTGFHCAPYVHDFIGSRMQSGTVRISLGIFNTMEEIDALVKALGEIL